MASSSGINNYWRSASYLPQMAKRSILAYSHRLNKCFAVECTAQRLLVRLQFFCLAGVANRTGSVGAGASKATVVGRRLVLIP